MLINLGLIEAWIFLFHSLWYDLLFFFHVPQRNHNLLSNIFSYIWLFHKLFHFLVMVIFNNPLIDADNIFYVIKHHMRHKALTYKMWGHVHDILCKIISLVSKTFNSLKVCPDIFSRLFKVSSFRLSDIWFGNCFYNLL